MRVGRCNNGRRVQVRSRGHVGWFLAVVIGSCQVEVLVQASSSDDGGAPVSSLGLHRSTHADAQNLCSEGYVAQVHDASIEMT